MTQKEQVKRYLLSGNSLTAMQALVKFGVFRLAARVYDIFKEDGIIISSVSVKVGKKSFSKYFIKQCDMPK